MKEEIDRLTILRLIENWVKAVQDRDITGAIAKHTDDVIMFDVPLPYYSKGIKAYARTWELFFASNVSGLESFEIKELEIVHGDSVAFCYGMIGVFESTVRISIGLKKVDGEWLIAHEHHSYPIDA